MKWLIVGRTGTGKDYLANRMREEGMRIVKSYATRPKRSADEDTHIFISKDEAKAIAEAEKAAKTVIRGYEYFATKKQVMDSDAYIIDPNGVYDLVHNMPDTPFGIIYITADEAASTRAAVARADNTEEEEKVVSDRKEAEAMQFDAFEARMDASLPIADNIVMVVRVTNDYHTDL